MPHFRIELHDWRLEGVHVGDLDVDCVSSAGVGGIWRAWEGALEMCEVASIDRRCEDTRVVLVLLYIAELLEDATLACARHCEDVLWFCCCCG